MADYFFSERAPGFYLPALHESLFVEQLDGGLNADGSPRRVLVPDPNGNIADAIGVTQEEHAALLAGQSEGKQITVVDGRVVLVDPVVDPADVWRRTKGDARAALQTSDVVLLRCYERGSPAPAEWIAYREALRAIIRADDGEALQPLPLQPDYPAL